jgi:hypothetical protein
MPDGAAAMVVVEKLDKVVWSPGTLLTSVSSEVDVIGVGVLSEPGSDEGGNIELEGGSDGSDTLGVPKKLDCEFVSVLGDTGDGYEGHGCTGSFDRRELDGDGSVGDETILEGRLVITVVISVVPERNVVVKTVARGCVGGTLGGIAALVGSDDMTGVSSGVLVGRVMNWLGGATLFSHCVVPLTTEK